MMLSKDTYTRRMQAFLLVLCISAFTLILHTLGIEAKLYWEYWWFDIVTHALGGLLIGLFAALLFERHRLPIIYTVLIIIIIGWEVFEILFAGVNPNTPGYEFDTVLDMIIGFGMAYGAVWWYRCARDCST